MPRATARTALQRKLHDWELRHLRQVVADQQAQIADLQRNLSWAESSAESWRDDALRAIEDAGCTPGLTQAGQLVPLHQGALQ